jgi:hypothetical protein
MRKIVFAAGAAVLVLIIDAWLSIRTLTCPCRKPNTIGSRQRIG